MGHSLTKEATLIPEGIPKALAGLPWLCTGEGQQACLSSPACPADLEGVHKHNAQLSISLTLVALSLPLLLSSLSRMSLTLKELICSSLALNNKPTVTQEFYNILIQHTNHIMVLECCSQNQCLISQKDQYSDSLGFLNLSKHSWALGLPKSRHAKDLKISN